MKRDLDVDMLRQGERGKRARREGRLARLGEYILDGIKLRSLTIYAVLIPERVIPTIMMSAYHSLLQGTYMLENNYPF